uniref:Uncharacterized protein n=1 Tax=Anguilla anguilla TaxID=7936 RepID=A0A0E9WCG6_ANGAN
MTVCISFFSSYQLHQSYCSCACCNIFYLLDIALLKVSCFFKYAFRLLVNLSVEKTKKKKRKRKKNF